MGYSRPPLNPNQEVINPEDLSPQDKKAYEDMIRKVQKYWMDADKQNFP
jgi:hypothetical protein